MPMLLHLQIQHLKISLISISQAENFANSYMLCGAISFIMLLLGFLLEADPLGICRKLQGIYTLAKPNAQ